MNKSKEQKIIQSIGDHFNFENVKKEFKTKDEFSTNEDGKYLECRHFNLLNGSGLHAYEITQINQTNADGKVSLDSAQRTLFLTPYYNETAFSVLMSKNSDYTQNMETYLGASNLEYPAYIEYVKDISPNGNKNAQINYKINKFAINSSEVDQDACPLDALKNQVMHSENASYVKEAYFKRIDQLQNTLQKF